MRLLPAAWCHDPLHFNNIFFVLTLEECDHYLLPTPTFLVTTRFPAHHGHDKQHLLKHPFKDRTPVTCGRREKVFVRDLSFSVSPPPSVCSVVLLRHLRWYHNLNKVVMLTTGVIKRLGEQRELFRCLETSFLLIRVCDSWFLLQNICGLFRKRYTIQIRKSPWNLFDFLFLYLSFGHMLWRKKNLKWWYDLSSRSSRTLNSSPVYS